jgi:23S rRNA (uracil1939-C5)-methyltransferase
MAKHSVLPFSILHMDSLGQGVSKTGPKVTFVPKTLPGEDGTAIVTAERKGVVFARLQSVTKPSPERIRPECLHFDQCPSCHYLHTSYKQELLFKRQNLEKLFQRLPHPEIELIPAPRRLGYRNRVQLHYDVRQQKLGMLDVGANQITPIPRCQIGEVQILEEITRLYEKENWILEASRQPAQGHVEIYLRDGKVLTTWNRPYAEGGFTQVFEEMNQVLKLRLQNWWGSEKADLLDLFAGNGNLSEELSYSNRLCVDLYPRNPGEQFLSQHLYEDEALRVVKSSAEKNNLRQPHLLLDPPRSGFKNLKDWVEEFKPQKVAYVSCDPHTLARDVQPLANYEIEHLLLLDFFPSTFHFETVIFLQRKD